MEKAFEISERIRKEIANEEIEILDGQKIFITISAGVATIEKDMNDLNDIIYKADIALYKAKRSGKNRTCV